jgi:hypothetical protein
VTTKAATTMLRKQIRDRLRAVAERAVQAQRMSVESDNLCDLIDDIDNDLQEVIALVNRVRRAEVGGDA